MNYTFSDYEAAVLAALAPLKEPTGCLKVLSGYSGEFDEGSVWDKFVGHFPGVLVEVNRASYEITNIRFYYQEVTASVIVGARSFKSQDQARGGTTGAFTILDEVRGQLLGNDLGLEIRPLLLVREEKVVSVPQVVVLLAEYRIINDRIFGEP